MDDQDSISGLSHLTKTALPIIGRVGTVVGGIVSLLVVLEQVSGQIIIAIAGFILVAATVTSAVVAFHRRTKIIDAKPMPVYSYPLRARRIAAGVMSIAGLILLIFVIQVGPNLFTPRPTPRSSQQVTSLTRAAEKIERAATMVTGLTALPTLPKSTPAAAPLPIEQLTDVALLIQLGNDAIDQKRYGQAVGIFNRAIQVEATNAQAQFGLGQAYFYLSNYAAAQEPFQNALRLNVNLHDAHAFLGWVYDYRQDKAKAIAEYDAFLKAAPRDDPYRPDIADRQKQLTSGTAVPTLTPRPTIVFTMPTIAK